MKFLIMLSLSILVTFGSLNIALAYSDEISHYENFITENSYYKGGSNGNPESTTDGTFDIHELPNGSDWEVWDEYEGEADEYYSFDDEDQGYVFATLEEIYKLIVEINEKQKDTLSKSTKELLEALEKNNETVKEIIEALSKDKKMISCDQELKESMAVFEKSVQKFKTRQCPARWLYGKRCIPYEIAQEYEEEILLRFEKLKKLLLVNEDADTIADICK